MKRNVLRMLAPIVALCLLIGILPITAVSAATTAVYDFNGTDFATGMLTTNLSGSSLVSDMSAVPSGYTGSVHAGTGSTYVAVGVDFALPVDTSKITSVKVRMYVPTYTTSGTPQLRIISTGESTSEPGWVGGAFVGTWGGAFDQWCDIDITDAVVNTVTKDTDGYLDRFVIAYRVYGTNATVYYDSLIIESEGDIFVGQSAEATKTTYDFNGTDFAVPTDTVGAISSALFLSGAVADTSSVPAGFTDGVYSASNATYCATWVDFPLDLDLTNVTSFKIRMHIPSYSYSGAPSFRIFGTGGAYAQQSHDGTYDEWFELELLDLLKNANVTKTDEGMIDKFVVAYRAYGSEAPTVYFDSITITSIGDVFVKEEEPEPVQVTITPTGFRSANTVDNGDWRFWLTVDNTIPDGYYYGQGKVPVTIHDKDDTLLASSENDGLFATLFHDGQYLMPYAYGGTSQYTYKNQPEEGDYVTFAAGTYYLTGDDNTSIVIEEDIVLSYTAGAWMLGRPGKTAVLDFNDVDFATSINGTGAVLSSQATSRLTDTSSVPAGFTDSVHAGGGATYAAVAVDFPLPMDTSVISKITVRMYVPNYTLSGVPKMRILSTDEKTGSTAAEYAFEASGGVYGAWCDFDITDAVKNVVTKDADGYLDRFVIAYRVYGSETPVVYYDNLSIMYDGELFIEEKFEVPADGVFDFDGKDFDVPTDTNSTINDTAYLSSAVTDTSSVPTGFSDGVYQSSNTIYASTWVDFHGKVDLSKVTSIKVRMYITSYTLESGKTPQFRVFGTGTSYAAQSHDGTYDQWFELELLDLLKNDSVTKNSDGSIEKFLLVYRVYGTTKPTIYYDSISIEGEDYFTVIDPSSFVTVTLDGLLENISGQSSSLSRWDSYISTSNNASLPGTPWATTFSDVRVNINNTECSFAIWRADDTYGLFLDLWYATLPQDMVYAVITVKAGTYSASDGSGGIIIASDFTYYLYNGDLWNAPPPADFAVDVTFEKIGEASKVSGSVWDMYPTPYDPSSTVGTPWASSWANVAYEIDGVAYTATMKRANNSEGMYFSIDSTALSPAADGVTIVIKAGTYLSNTAYDPSIRITEDFTFYVIGGSPTTYFDFDDPAFTATIETDIALDAYVVDDAETVTINGVTYHKGDAFATLGTHTLVYTRFGREYTRKLLVYRAGELGDDETTDICDLVKMKRYHAGLVEVSDSAKLGADMNSSREKEEDDIMLLRKLLLMDSGLLLLCPETGIEALHPSEYVADLETDYDLIASATAAMKNGTELYHRSPLQIKWISKENVSEYKVSVATQADFSDVFVYTVTVPQVTLMNLLPATTYYWKVTAGEVETEARSFITADTVRTLTIGGVDNTRDIGGYAGLDGKKLKYGMVYRSATLDEITDDGLYQMLTVLGVKTDLDLRTPGEGSAGSGSPLGDSVNYLNFNGPYYWTDTNGLLAESYREALRGEIRAFTDEANYPIVVHCSVGRDRTGTLMFLIEGLCGVSKSDLFFEYELSFLGRIGGGASANVPTMMNYVDEMYDGIQSYAPDGTFAEACEAFMLSVGITQDEIDTIRELMLEAE